MEKKSCSLSLTSVTIEVVNKLTFLLLTVLIFSVASCSILKSPQMRALQYFNLLYQGEFDKLKKVAKEPALLQAAYFQGHLSEMTEPQKGAFANPQISVIEFHMTGPKEATVAVNVSFPSGSFVQNTAIMRRYDYIWYVEDLKNPIVSEAIYAY